MLLVTQSNAAAKTFPPAVTTSPTRAIPPVELRNAFTAVKTSSYMDVPLGRMTMPCPTLSETTAFDTERAAITDGTKLIPSPMKLRTKEPGQAYRCVGIDRDTVRPASKTRPASGKQPS